MKWYKISNADGKVWIMPSNNLKTGLELYQPSGTKGKLLKRFFPYLHHFKPVRDKCGAITSDYALNDKLLKLAERIFKTDKLEFSIFEGTPSVHQKTTIQIFKGQKILGYAKISENRDIISLFKHEEKVLNFLSKAGIKGVPECLYCSTDDGEGVFFQSTQKSRHSHSPHVWTSSHQEFLEQLYKKTVNSIQFEDSDLYVSLNELSNRLAGLPLRFQNIIRKNIEKTFNDYKGKKVDFSAFHADFTPWNMFLNGRVIFVFDWEYAGLSYPPYLDKYHFLTQQMIHVDHLSPEIIFSSLKKEDWFRPEMFRIYLLDIISRFTSREKGQISHGLAESLEIWCKLLDLN